MSATYKPGTVAVVTWDNATFAQKEGGASDVQSARALRTKDGHWSLAISWGSCIQDEVVTDVRPLVVLDLGDLAVLKRAWENTEVAMKEGHTLPFILQGLRDEILRQTKPPRIPEPGLWGVVEAAVPESGGSRWPFVHDTDQGSSEWTCVNDGDHYDWDALVDPVLIREGVES